MNQAANHSESFSPLLMRLTTKLPFKKYKGEEFQKVVEKDIDYVKWLYREKMIEMELAAWNHFRHHADLLKDKNQVGGIYSRYHKTNKRR